MKFRLISRTVEAMQISALYGMPRSDRPLWVEELMEKGRLYLGPDWARFKTLEGTDLYADRSEWIVRDHLGSVTFMKASIFAKTYEEVTA